MKPILVASVVALVCVVHASPVQACDSAAAPTCANLWNAERWF